MPAYKGGPFISRPRAGDESAEAAAAHFLAQHTVPDAFLAPAIDLLARDDDPKTHELVSIDFKSLSVRQLGSIYEGLLEFRLVSWRRGSVLNRVSDERAEAAAASANAAREARESFGDSAKGQVAQTLAIVRRTAEDLRALEPALKLIYSRKVSLEKVHTHTFGLQDIDLAVRPLAGHLEGGKAIHVMVAQKVGYMPATGFSNRL